MTSEDSPIGRLLSAVDPDSDGLIFALAEGGAPENGSIVVYPDGSYLYSPGPNYSGTDTFEYEVSDGQGGTATATVNKT